MVIKQVYNKKIKAWVKYRVTKKGSKIIDVKERKDDTPFKKIKKQLV